MRKGRPITSALVLVILTVWMDAAQRMPPASAQGKSNDVHFHHVHLNVTDVQKSTAFYQQFFGAVPLKFAGRSDALYTDRSFILLTKAATPPPAQANTGIWHIGWGGMNVVGLFTNLRFRGVQFQTMLSRQGDNYYFYAYGPDKELVEIASADNRLFNHVHLLSRDPAGTATWYADKLGISLRQGSSAAPGRPVASAGSSAGALHVDNVGIEVFPQPEKDPVPPRWNNDPVVSIQPTKGHVIDHVAFSYRRVEPVFERLSTAGVQVVEPIAVRPDYGFKSFFVLGPDQVLIEIVEANPLPDAAWEVN